MIKGLTYIVLIFVLAFSACAKKSATEKPVRLPSKNSKFLLSQINKNKLEFKSLNAKFTARTTFNDQKLNFKGNLRMQKDSIIWLSITKLGGVEMVRMKLTQDSVKFINKWDKEYFIGSIDKLNTFESIELGFPQIQNILIGALIEYNPEDKFSSNNDNVTYLLSSKNKSKVKKAGTIVESDSLMELSIMDKKYQKMIDKSPDGNFIIKSYYLYPDNYFLARQTINLIALHQAVDVVYNDYILLDDKYPFSLNQSIRIASTDKAGRIDLKYSNVQLNMSNTYPFKISSKYEPIKKRK